MTEGLDVAMLRPLLDQHDRIGIVCHDAGAANILIAWIDEAALPAVVPIMAGPARAIWERRFSKVPVSTDPETDLSTCGAIVTGSGWASNHEYRAIQQAAGLRIHTIAVIDHWVNYRVRFIRDHILALPDEIWVTDEDAVEVARRELPEVPVKLMPNYYSAEQLRRIKPWDTNAIPRLLYATEPIRVDWGLRLPGEFAALNFFADNFSTLGLPCYTQIFLRLHPSECPGKYDAWLADNRDLNFLVDAKNDLAESLGEVGWVAGCESSVLALALQAGRTAFCTLPPGAPPCRLPQRGLIHLRDLGQEASHA